MVNESPDPPPKPPQSAAELGEALGEPLGGSGGARGELWRLYIDKTGALLLRKALFHNRYKSSIL